MIGETAMVIMIIEAKEEYLHQIKEHVKSITNQASLDLSIFISHVASNSPNQLEWIHAGAVSPTLQLILQNDKIFNSIKNCIISCDIYCNQEDIIANFLTDIQSCIPNTRYIPTLTGFVLNTKLK